MFESAVAQLILAFIGGGIFTVAALGLSLGGDLPLIRIPDKWKPWAKFGYTVGLVVGITLLLEFGHSDTLTRLAREL